MFNCQVCGKTQPAGVQPRRVVLKSREVWYKEGSKGQEIVEEANVCDVCAAAIPSPTPTPAPVPSSFKRWEDLKKESLTPDEISEVETVARRDAQELR